MPDSIAPVGVRVCLTDWSTDEAALSQVRQQVFCVEQGVPVELEWDRADKDALHVIAWRDGEAVGTGRLLPDGKIGRMAVLRASRRLGIGQALLHALLDAAAARGDAQVYLHAQESAVSFYEPHGFIAEGEPYREAGIMHRTMRRVMVAP